jgi:hypothetical protein
MEGIGFLLPKNNRILNITLVTIILVFPFIFIWQTADLTDAGFQALSYQNFFSNIHTESLLDMRFLTNFIGALWFKAFPSLGIVGLEFLYLIVFFITNLLIYNLLKDLILNKTKLLFGILLGTIYATTNETYTFAYTNCSWLFLILSAYSILNNIKLTKKKFAFFFSGIYVSLAALSRFPSIIFLAFIPLILLYNQALTGNLKSIRGLKNVFIEFCFIAIGFISFSIFCGLILRYVGAYNGHFASFLDNFRQIKGTGQSSYSFQNLFNNYWFDFLEFVPHLISISTLLISISFVYSFIKFRKIYITVIVFIIVLLTIYKYLNYDYSINTKYFGPSLVFLPLIIGLFLPNPQLKAFKLVVLTALIIPFCQIAGSDTGIFLNWNYAFMLFIPLTIIIIYYLSGITFNNMSFNVKPILYLFVSVFLLYGIYARIGFLYGVDSGLTVRLKAIYPIHHPKMKKLFTTKNHALYIQNVSASIERNLNKKDNSLFIYGKPVMFYYLTDNFPPIKNFWLRHRILDANEMLRQLVESIKITGKWPLIIDTRDNIMGEEGKSILNSFLYKNGYICVEAKEEFKIWNKRSIVLKHVL